MWNTALTFALVLVAVALALITQVLALVRGEQALKIYASAFWSAAVGFVLLAGQGMLSPWLSIMLANFLIVLMHLLLAWGIRVFYKEPRPFPPRFILYLLLYFILLTTMTFRLNSYRLRAVMTSITIMLLTVEFMLPLFAGFRGMRGRIRYPVSLFLCFFLAMHGIRIGLVTLDLFPAHLFISDNPVSTFTLMFSIFSGIIWAGTVMILDGTRLMADMAKKNELLKNMALTDELTGAFNRYYLDQTLSGEMDRQDRYREQVSLVVLDLDYFKRINDLLGHDAGDAVLAEAARRIRNTLRESDLFFRIGGEEFLILAPHTDSSGAAVLAEKVRHALSGVPFPLAGTISASFGVAERVTGESRDDWFKRADQALYRAKEGGRNRVEVCQETRSKSNSMIHIDWKREWESGEMIIDAEHQEILLLGNELLELSLAAVPIHRIQEQLDRFMNHIQIHFENEESILRQLGYPELEEHMRVHKNLLTDAGILRDKFMRGEVDPGLFFNFLIGKVVVDHLLTTDARFFPYTRRRRQDAMHQN